MLVLVITANQPTCLKVAGLFLDSLDEDMRPGLHFAFEYPGVINANLLLSNPSQYVEYNCDTPEECERLKEAYQDGGMFIINGLGREIEVLDPNCRVFNVLNGGWDRAYRVVKRIASA